MKYNCSLSLSSILPVIESENEYFIIRYKLQQQPSAKQIQTAKRASRVDIRNELRFNNNVQTKSTATVKEKRKNKFKNNLIIHCRHEERLECMKRDMHQIYNNIFNNASAIDVKLIVGHRNNPPTKRELTRKRPPKRLLKNIMSKSKSFLHYK